MSQDPYHIRIQAYANAGVWPVIYPEPGEPGQQGGGFWSAKLLIQTTAGSMLEVVVGYGYRTWSDAMDAVTQIIEEGRRLTPCQAHDFEAMKADNAPAEAYAIHFKAKQQT